MPGIELRGSQNLRSIAISYLFCVPYKRNLVPCLKTYIVRPSFGVMEDPSENNGVFSGRGKFSEKPIFIF